MDETLSIVIWQDSRGTWHAEPNGVFVERRLAENLIECKKAAGEAFKFAIVDGPIISPFDMKKAEEELGAF